MRRRRPVLVSMMLVTLLMMAPQWLRAATSDNSYQRISLYADRSAATNVIDRYVGGYPALVNGDNLWVTRVGGDTMCVFRSFADSGIVLRATDAAPSFVDYSLSPPRLVASLGLMIGGSQVHADDGGRVAMRVAVFYENGDSASAVLAVGSQLRDIYYGWDFCYGSQLFFYNATPSDPLSAELWADPEAGGGNFLDAQEIRLPANKRALKASRIRISSVPLGRPCMGGTLWSAVYLAGLTTWSAAPRVLLVHGICGNENSWGPVAQVLADSGFVVERLQYGNPDYSLRPAAYVSALATKLSSMGPGPVAVVAHSMGGLISREYMRRQAASGRPSRIAQLITLGTPHHGSDLTAWLLEQGRALDLECAKRLPGQSPCHAFDQIAPFLNHCSGSAYSRPALLDMIPGAWFLNRLNYGADSSHYDSPASKGWSVHAIETGLTPGVYHATIAGTGSICRPAKLRDGAWGKGASYNANDGTVAVGSALLTSASAFRARDVDLPLSDSLTHSAAFYVSDCRTPYYASQALARKVVRILATAPSSPPVTMPSDARPFEPMATAAESEDSLQTIPAIADSVSAGQMVAHTVAIPATTLLSVTLVSTDAHLALRAPNGTLITAADTSSIPGLSFFTVPGGGLENFMLAGPLAGMWTIRVDATASAYLQQYGGVVSYASAVATRLISRAPITYTGDSIRVAGSVIDGGSLRTDLTWTCRVIGPDSVANTLSLYDDGAHGDSLADDGVYGAAFAPAAGIGGYRIVGSAVVPGRGEFVAGSDCEVADHQDLAIQASDITLSRNRPQAGDSLTIFATVHNSSSVAALGVQVEIRDLATGTLLDSSTVDVPAVGAVAVQAPWVVAAPDSHTIQVRVSPYVIEEDDYANNTSERLIVVGEPLGVGPPTPSGRGVQFYPPRPNPTAGSVVLAFVMPRSGPAALGVFDVLGRRVRSWYWPTLAPGPQSVTWDGRGSSGARLTPGVYLCRLEVEGQRLQHKVVLRH